MSEIWNMTFLKRHELSGFLDSSFLFSVDMSGFCDIVFLNWNNQSEIPNTTLPICKSLPEI